MERNAQHMSDGRKRLVFGCPNTAVELQGRSGMIVTLSKED
jgi:hypothetical protein